ncbi:MAG: GNAT family N-acetyltransferase [Sphingobacteriales bacterium]
MAFKIIKAADTNAAIISAVGRQSFYDAFHSIFINKDELAKYLDKTYDVKKIANSINNLNNIFFIAYDNDRPVGFAKIKRQSTHQQIKAATQTELQKIYVLEEYHGTGAGAALLNVILETAHTIQPEYIWLNVHVGNTKAKRFYEKNGFVQVGKHYHTIGTQKFEFDLMDFPISINETVTV